MRIKIRPIDGGTTWAIDKQSGDEWSKVGQINSPGNNPSKPYCAFTESSAIKGEFPTFNEAVNFIATSL